MFAPACKQYSEYFESMASPNKRNVTPVMNGKKKVMFCKVRFFVYPGIYPGIVSSVQHYTLPDRFCEFCKTFIPLPDSSVTSVINLIPYRKYPYPTEHNLGQIPSWRTGTLFVVAVSLVTFRRLMQPMRWPMRLYAGYVCEQVDDVEEEVRSLRKQQREVRRRYRKRFMGLFWAACRDLSLRYG